MRVEVLGEVERRRRWSRDDKMRIIEETLAPGAVVTEIARRHGIATSLVFTWRRRARLATVASAARQVVQSFWLRCRSVRRQRRQGDAQNAARRGSHRDRQTIDDADLRDGARRRHRL